jgi:hypothetical protein
VQPSTSPIPEHGLGAAALDDIEAVLTHSRPVRPAFFGYVLGSGEPVAAVPTWSRAC